MTLRVAGLDGRPMTDADAPAIISLVEAAYREHPGCVLDLPGVDADLPALASRLCAAGGQGWVVEDAGELVGCVGLVPSRVDGHPAVELKRLYVAPSHRHRGIGTNLVLLVEEVALTDHGATAVELWSDTRFADAHRLYEACGYVRQPETRELHDPSHTTEYRFVRHLQAG